jgi:hypothetical protein
VARGASLPRNWLVLMHNMSNLISFNCEFRFRKKSAEWPISAEASSTKVLLAVISYRTSSAADIVRRARDRLPDVEHFA